jgi:hypothetical protein
MKLFQIFIFFIITQISINYNATEMKLNIMEYKGSLSPYVGGYLYYLNYDYSQDYSYFEFEIELDNKNDDKSISLAFVKDDHISSYSSYPLINQTISYSELDIQEKGEKKIIKWSKTFPFYKYYLGIFINPDKQIEGIAIKLFKDCRPNDLITIIIFAVFFGICIFLCVLTLIMTKACGSKDSNDIVINKIKSAGLVQNELINGSQA